MVYVCATFFLLVGLCPSLTWASFRQNVVGCGFCKQWSDACNRRGLSRIECTYSWSNWSPHSASVSSRSTGPSLLIPDGSSRWGGGSRFPLPTLSLRQARCQRLGVRCPRACLSRVQELLSGVAGCGGLSALPPRSGPLPSSSSVQRGFPCSPRGGLLLLPLPRQHRPRAGSAVGFSPSSSRRWFLHLTACEVLTRSLPGTWGFKGFLPLPQRFVAFASYVRKV